MAARLISDACMCARLLGLLRLPYRRENERLAAAEATATEPAKSEEPEHTYAAESEISPNETGSAEAGDEDKSGARAATPDREADAVDGGVHYALRKRDRYNVAAMRITDGDRYAVFTLKNRDLSYHWTTYVAAASQGLHKMMLLFAFDQAELLL